MCYSDLPTSSDPSELSPPAVEDEGKDPCTDPVMDAAPPPIKGWISPGLDEGLHPGSIMEFSVATVKRGGVGTVAWKEAMPEA